MATKRIKDISTTATTFAADDFIALDASSVGTRKMAKASLITQVGANYLEKADNLSDVASKDTSKLNLEVPNVGTAANEVPVNGMLGDLAFQSSAGVVVDDLTVDGHFTGAVGKPMPVNGPTMRFDGVDDHVSFAAPVGSAFSFTNGTDDTPFSASFWVKMADLNTNGLVAKYGSNNSIQEWGIATSSSGQLQFIVKDSSGNFHQINSESSALNEHLGKWVFITVTYAGAGPNSSNSFAFANVGMQFHINAQAIAVTTTSTGSYGGMSSTNQAVTLGQYFSTAYILDGEIRDVKIFNKELSAAEVKEVYSNGSLGSVLDARAEQFDTSTGKLYDLSGNGFVGTQSGGVELRGKKFPIYETGTWTPTVSFGGGSTGITYSTQEGFYTRVGRICYFTCSVVLSNKGSSTGIAKITGLPFSGANLTGNVSTVGPLWVNSAVGLASLPFGSVTDSEASITLYQSGATGQSNLTDANYGNATNMRISGTYQIS